MIGIATIALLLLVVTTAIPVIFLAIQVGAALLPARTRTPALSTHTPRMAVVMPAHNEEAIIPNTIASVLADLPQPARMLVIADNCTDSTAHIAVQSGAEVAVRQDATRLGKGYALDYGVRILSADPPEVVLFIDADCEISPGSLDRLAKLCAGTGRPIQARYSMLAAAPAAPADRISQFAWTVKTFVRPLGSARLGWPCQLMGSGMAMPFDLIRQTDLANGHLAEDQKLSAELGMKGAMPLFCPQAQVFSRFPQRESGKRQQRRRWEHGHLAIIGEFFPALMSRAIWTRSLLLLVFTLDLCMPPLSLLAMLLGLTQIIALAWFVATGTAEPLVTSVAVFACFLASIGAAWWCFGRDSMSLRELIAVPGYCLLKIPSFVRFFFDRQIEWVRTER